MHAPRTLLDPATESVRKLARRGHHLDLAQLERLFSLRVATVGAVDEARAEANRLAARIAAANKRGEDITTLREHARSVKTRVQELTETRRRLTTELREFLLGVPNLPADDLPDGDSDEDAELVGTWGAKPVFEFAPADHVAIGERLGIPDFARATKLSGPRFAVARGAGARLERAIADFLLDLHTERHGYTEFSVPAVVSRQTMTGTGQLPKFEADLFRTGVADRERYLIPPPRYR